MRRSLQVWWGPQGKAAKEARTALPLCRVQWGTTGQGWRGQGSYASLQVRGDIHFTCGKTSEKYIIYYLWGGACVWMSLPVHMWSERNL